MFLAVPAGALVLIVGGDCAHRNSTRSILTEVIVRGINWIGPSQKYIYTQGDSADTGLFRFSEEVKVKEVGSPNATNANLDVHWLGMTPPFSEGLEGGIDRDCSETQL